jgi:malonyl-CoA O-methyltransferase
MLDSFVDKAKVKGSFAKAAQSYDAMANLQRRVGQELLELSAMKNLHGTVLDVGCGTGFLTGKLSALPGYQAIIALDIALPMLQMARDHLMTGSPLKDCQSYSNKLFYLCADAEKLPLQSQSVDSIFSNVALQWCQNLNAVFSDFNRILKPNGQLVFSTFGTQTLQELKAAWAIVDSYTHVNDFYAVDEIKVFLKRAGFQQIAIETKIYCSYYQSVWELMRELKGIGAHNVTAGRNRKLTTRRQLQGMVAEYESLRTEQGIPATFEVIYVFAHSSINAV